MQAGNCAGAAEMPLWTQSMRCRLKGPFAVAEAVGDSGAIMIDVAVTPGVNAGKSLDSRHGLSFSSG